MSLTAMRLTKQMYKYVKDSEIIHNLFYHCSSIRYSVLCSKIMMWMDMQFSILLFIRVFQKWLIFFRNL